MRGAQRVLTVAFAAVLAVVGAGCSSSAPSPPGSTRSGPPAAASAGTHRTGVSAEEATTAAFPAATERSRPGDPRWNDVTVGPQEEIEGYTDHDSVLPGAAVRLYVSTTFPTFQVVALRMGWYRGDLARRVWASPWLPGHLQPAASVTGSYHLPRAPWRPSLTIGTAGWLPGDYLLRLDSKVGTHRRFVPLTVRSPSVADALVVVNADTTWQAYNAWGGYSLYHGPDGLRADRAREVSFDRPYDFGSGGADFIGAELPLVSLAEKLGLRLAYATDVDLHRDPRLLDGARAVLSLGHDEYWSPAMRQSVTAARDRGVNVAFFGANAIYRKIRFLPGPSGPDRIEVNYKDDTDPIGATDPAAVTTQWRAPPSDDPESSLTGTFYQCNPVDADMLVADPNSWLLTGLASGGEHLHDLVGSEYDRVDVSAPTPHPIDVLMHSPVTCGGGPDHADAAYYTTRSGAGVFDAGTSSWVCALRVGDCPDGRGSAGATRVAVGITTRLLRAYAAGPAGRTHPARDNTAAIYGR